MATTPSGGTGRPLDDASARALDELAVSADEQAGALVAATVLRISAEFVGIVPGSQPHSQPHGQPIVAHLPIEDFQSEAGELEVQVGDTVWVAGDVFDSASRLAARSRETFQRLNAWRALEKALAFGDTVTGTVLRTVRGGMSVLVEDLHAFLPESHLAAQDPRDTRVYEGKTLPFKVLRLNHERHSVLLSRRGMAGALAADDAAGPPQTLSEGAIVHGTVTSLTDYGAFVDLGGINGLLHITDLAWRRVHHPSELLTVGQALTAKVLKYDADKNRVSLGLKQLGNDPWPGLERRFPPGTRLAGKVTQLADYGVFVEIEPGIEGMVHVSEMDWTLKHLAPSSIVSLGDEVEVMVLEVDEERRRVSLGMKQCTPSPWEAFAESVQPGDTIIGPVRSVTDFGLFVGLTGGIDGLVHLSDVSWSESGEAALRSYKKGQQVSAVVLAVDAARERVSLGIKQLQPDPRPRTTRQAGGPEGPSEDTAALTRRIAALYGEGDEYVIARTILNRLEQRPDAAAAQAIDFNAFRQMIPGAQGGRHDHLILRAIQCLSDTPAGTLEAVFAIDDGEGGRRTLSAAELRQALDHGINPLSGEADPMMADKVELAFLHAPKAARQDRLLNEREELAEPVQHTQLFQRGSAS